MHDLTYTFTIPLEMIFAICTILAFIFGVLLGSMLLYREVPGFSKHTNADDWPPF